VTPDQFTIKVAGWENYMLNDFTKDILLRGCVDLKAKIAHRVRETNILGSGKSYDYSKKPMLVGRKSFLPNKGYAWKEVYDDAKSKKEKDEGIHWVTIKHKNGNTYRLIVLPGGYAELRRLEKNLNTKKNYSRSGEMWKGFGIKQVEPKKITIGGRDEIYPASQQRINFNSERDKDNIIAPNQKEIDELTRFLEIETKKYINASLRS
jgi:hypothetical protein